MMSSSRTSVVRVSAARASARVARAFSLIEILVSIIILGLGMLGLGAIFPVVIREQRLATETVTGTIAGNNVRAIISATIAKNARVEYTHTIKNNNSTFRAEYYGLAGMLAGGCPPETDPTGSTTGRMPPTTQGLGTGEAYGRWATAWSWINVVDPRSSPRLAELERGRVEFPEPTSVRQALDNWETPFEWVSDERPTASQRVIYPIDTLNVSDRLTGAGGGLDESPTMIWDMVPRRIYKGSNWKMPVGGTVIDAPRPSIQDDLQLAVFIRKIDSGIRVKPGSTLRNDLMSAIRTGLGPLPLGARTNGDPTYDGTDGNGGQRYSWPITLSGIDDRTISEASHRVFYFGAVPAAGYTIPNDLKDPNEWLEGIDMSTVGGRALAQVGQKLIDNLSNVYTVVRVEDSTAIPGTKRVRLDPAPQYSDVVQDSNSKPRRLREFLLTPQVPVSAFVMDVPIKRVIK